MAGHVRPRLLLFFDVNKTVVVEDQVKGMGLLATLNSVLSDACWGRQSEAARTPVNPTGWQPTEPPVPPMQQRPSVPGAADMVTFGQTVEHMDRKTRNGLKNVFCEPGGAGQVYAPVYTSLLHELRLPSGNSFGIPQLQSGYHYLLPSFLRLVLRLVEEKWSFSVVFRTFGVDTPHLASEWNSFCAGRHPLNNRLALLDGQDPGLPDLRLLLPERTACFLRTSTDLSGTAGVHLSMVSPATGLVTMLHGRTAVHEAILQAGNTMAIQDDFDFWYKSKEIGPAGKLFLVDRQATDMCTVFFDDNVDGPDGGIVDCRDLATGASVPYDEARGTYIHRVDTIAAIRDHNYFYHLIMASITNQQQQQQQQQQK